MACGILYKDAIVVTTVKKVDDSYVLDLPFKVYGQDIVRNGDMVTYSLDKLEGLEVMAKVDYRVEDESEVQKFVGLLSDPKAAVKYATHYPVTLADAKATYDEAGNKVPYAGADASEKADFCAALSFQKVVAIDVEPIKEDV